MRIVGSLFVAASAILVSCVAGECNAQESQSPDIPVIHVTSNLVFLDVTVIGDNGKPIVKGLSQHDFVITEDKKPQTITSFEEPNVHVVGPDAENPEGKAPVSVYVLDLLNESPEEAAYYRFELDRYFKSLPPQLAGPAELLALGNQSLELLQGFTQDREELLSALHHLPASVPYKLTMPGFGGERFVQSVDAIQQIVVQNEGIAGRKNIFWLGTGGPPISPRWITGDGVEALQRYVHETANMLVEQRITLYVCYPGLKPRVGGGVIEGSFAGEGNPFSSVVSFGAIVNETGGSLYYNRNDIADELARSQLKGSQFYTLTYQPQNGMNDGKFRKIRVDIKKNGYRALTKEGYFAAEKNEVVDPRRQQIIKLGTAARSTIPMTGIPLKVSRIVRHPDTQTVEVSFLVPAAKLRWEPGDPGTGTSRSTIRLAAAGFSRSPHPLVWKVEDFNLKTGTTDAQQLAKGIVPVSFTVANPAKLNHLRILLETEDQGEMGSLDLNRKEIDAAQSLPTPAPPAPAQPPLSAPKS